MMLLAGVSAGTVTASEIDFTYNVNDEPPKVYGFNKKERYDIALQISDPIYTGAQVTGFTVDIPVDNPALSEVTGWLSTELLLDNKLNAPNICTQSAEVVDQTLDVTFNPPYTITTDGVWIGYSLTITDLNEDYVWPGQPIACIESKENLDKGLWVHTSRSRLKWTNLGESIGAVSTMVVHLTTEFGEYDVAISLPDNSYVVKGDECTIPATIINHGTDYLQDLTYRYTISEQTYTGSLHLENPLEGSGKSTEVQLPIAAYPELGDFPFSVTLETSNGQPNTDPYRTGKGTLNVWPLIPVTRPLVEEFTGLNCGYCPRGYVAMEEMHNLFGDRFVGLAYHSQSYETAMVTVANDDFPIDVPGFPASCINRTAEMDPSYLPYSWEDYAKIIVPVDLDVEIEYNDGESEIIATADVSFVKDMTDADYRLSFALVADNLQNESWKQTNYYAGKQSGDGVDSELWDIFLNGGAKVGGLVFNDVVAYYKDIHGIEDSVPTEIKAEEPIVYQYRIPIEDVRTISGKEFLTEGCKLYVVCIILDGKTGLPVNCNKSAALAYSPSGIDTPVADNAEVTEIIYHNLQGIRIRQPEGTFIRTEICGDGSHRVSKIIAH